MLFADGKGVFLLRRFALPRSLGGAGEVLGAGHVPAGGARLKREGADVVARLCPVTVLCFQTTLFDG